MYGGMDARWTRIGTSNVAKTGASASTAATIVAATVTGRRFRPSHEAGLGSRPASASSPTATSAATKKTKKGEKWSGRISLRSGSVDSSFHGSHKCASPEGPFCSP